MTTTHIYGFSETGILLIFSSMKTTVDIADSLLAQAKELAREQRVTLRSLIEEGLRKVIEERYRRGPTKVRPVTFRGQGLSEEFKDASWQRIREAAYEGRGT